MLTQVRLKEKYRYSPKTGLFKRLKGLITRPVGTIHPTTGYVVIMIDDRQYTAHRLAFLYMTGKFPKEVDHKNRVRTDNRWSNLREVTRSENIANSKMRKDNTTGFCGVHVHRGRYCAQARLRGVRTHIGLFDTAEEAGRAALAARKREYGAFANR